MPAQRIFEEEKNNIGKYIRIKKKENNNNIEQLQ